MSGGPVRKPSCGLFGVRPLYRKLGDEKKVAHVAPLVAEGAAQARRAVERGDGVEPLRDLADVEIGPRAVLIAPAGRGPRRRRRTGEDRDAPGPCGAVAFIGAEQADQLLDLRRSFRRRRSPLRARAFAPR